MSPLKDPKDFTLIGKPLKRLDTPDKVNGTAVYGIDAMLPGMKFATLAAVPGVRRQGRQGRRQRGEDSSRRAPGRRARRPGRRGRRSHVGGQEGPRGAQDRLGRGPERQGQLEGHLAAICARRARRTASVAKSDGDIAKGAGDGREVRGGLRAAVPGARDDGADELHRPCHAGRLRDLDRHAGPDAACSRRPRRPPACRSRR